MEAERVVIRLCAGAAVEDYRGAGVRRAERRRDLCEGLAVADGDARGRRRGDVVVAPVVGHQGDGVDAAHVGHERGLRRGGAVDARPAAGGQRDEVPAVAQRVPVGLVRSVEVHAEDDGRARVGRPERRHDRRRRLAVADRERRLGGGRCVPVGAIIDDERHDVGACGVGDQGRLDRRHLGDVGRAARGGARERPAVGEGVAGGVGAGGPVERDRRARVGGGERRDDRGRGARGDVDGDRGGCALVGAVVDDQRRQVMAREPRRERRPRLRRVDEGGGRACRSLGEMPSEGQRAARLGGGAGGAIELDGLAGARRRRGGPRGGDGEFRDDADGAAAGRETRCQQRRQREPYHGRLPRWTAGAKIGSELVQDIRRSFRNVSEFSGVPSMPDLATL